MLPELSLSVLVAMAASQPATLSGTVVDASGAPVSGARVEAMQTTVTATSGADGAFTLEGVALPLVVMVTAPGFADAVVTIDSGTFTRIVLRPRGISETVTVTAAAGERRIFTPASATVLDAEALALLPAFALDDQLRSVPGFSLFRRSSSRVTNPTAQGVTLRGLAGSGASRTLVLADGVPLNDPFGGWVYWDRIPAAAIDRVEVARGGASDLHGSDAMGGAIRIETAATGARLVAEGGQHGTARLSAFAGHRRGRWDASGALERSTTDGYVTVAPESRGEIDVPATSRASTGYARIGAAAGAVNVDVRGAYFHEDRGNGTPFQTNATIARQVTASARGEVLRGMWSARAFHLSQDYDQTFSAVLAARAAERPTSAQRVDSWSSGGAAEWVRAIGQGVVFLSGFAREVRADLVDQPLPIGNTRALPARARQRSGGGVLQTSFAPTPRVSISGGVRGEVWTSSLLDSGAAFTYGFFAPRATVTVRASDRWSFRAGVQSGYRTPTINELYRDFRVGNVLTQANRALEPESSTGFEGSALLTLGRVTARATGFWTRMSDAIVNVTIAPSANPILRQRQNAGRIRAAGAEFESDVRVMRNVDLTASVAVIDSVFTDGVDLEGLRVPQVPRVHASTGVRVTTRRLAASADWRYISRQYDDDRNQFPLDPSSMMDGRLGWRVRRGVELFAAVENMFDEEQDVGRTPLRTIGLPRTFRSGVRLGVR